MSQRVNIQYSVEVDTLQETVDYLHNRVIRRVDILNQSMLGSSSFIDLGFIEEIDKIRLELAQIDTQLADLDRIVKGYISLKATQSNGFPRTSEETQQVNAESSSQGE
jgi:hypothetical protein